MLREKKQQRHIILQVYSLEKGRDYFFVSKCLQRLNVLCISRVLKQSCPWNIFSLQEGNLHLKFDQLLNCLLLQSLMYPLSLVPVICRKMVTEPHLFKLFSKVCMRFKTRLVSLFTEELKSVKKNI